MTRKDCELIARALYRIPPAISPCAHARHVTIASNLAAALAETNPNFDRARFMRACGVAV